MIIIENEKAIVYLYGFSTRKRMYIDNLLGILSEQTKNNISIAIVLIHDGVIGTSQRGTIPRLLDKLLNLSISVFALLPDLLARGIEPNTVDPRIKCIEYEDLVEILAETPKVASWM
ncbi:MAG: sulfurtransferase complex subunit TusB [Candidatus Lokiarchaeota archaeon]|nr:sulfurtransferase complex subunit TusB [Candidatus Lokiarchaeota archaeon]